MSTNKSSTWGHVVTPAAHHQSHLGNYVTSLIHLQLATEAFKGLLSLNIYIDIK